MGSGNIDHRGPDTARIVTGRTMEMQENCISASAPRCENSATQGRRANTGLGTAGFLFSAPCWTRTNNLLIKSQLLCQLS